MGIMYRLIHELEVDTRALPDYPRGEEECYILPKGGYKIDGEDT